MRVGIMQPYFFPYIGYFQLINAVDKFVVYDNIQYTKRGWINRNRILVNGSDEYITLPLRKDSDYLDVKDRVLSGAFRDEGDKLIRRVRETYRKAPHYSEAMDLFEKSVKFENPNLFAFIFNAIRQTCVYLEISTDLLVSSALDIDHSLKSQDRVLATVKNIGGDTYINPIGGADLYSREAFARHGIQLKFIQSKPIEYRQFGNSFVPWLSILDVIMFNSKEEIGKMLQLYTIE